MLLLYSTWVVVKLLRATVVFGFGCPGSFRCGCIELAFCACAEQTESLLFWAKPYLIWARYCLCKHPYNFYTFVRKFLSACTLTGNCSVKTIIQVCEVDSLEISRLQSSASNMEILAALVLKFWISLFAVALNRFSHFHSAACYFFACPVHSKHFS